MVGVDRDSPLPTRTGGGTKARRRTLFPTAQTRCHRPPPGVIQSEVEGSRLPPRKAGGIRPSSGSILTPAGARASANHRRGGSGRGTGWAEGSLQARGWAEILRLRAQDDT